MSTDINWTPKQRAFLAHWAQIPNRTQEQCARLAMVDKSTVTRWIRSQPDFVLEMARVRAETAEQFCAEQRQRLIEALPDVISEKLKLGLTANSEHVRHLELKDLTDRALGTAPLRHETTGKDGGPIEHAATVTHEHTFDFEGFRDAFSTFLDRGRGDAAPRDSTQ